MKKLLIGVLALVSVPTMAAQVDLKAGESIELIPSSPTVVTCQPKSATAPYLCRLNIQQKEVVLSFKDRSNPAAIEFKYLSRPFSQDGTDSAEIMNQRSITVINDELNVLVGKGICTKY
jgi:hypothetical protein